jgi:hypothetical protein
MKKDPFHPLMRGVTENEPRLRRPERVAVPRLEWAASILEHRLSGYQSAGRSSAARIGEQVRAGLRDI